MLGALVPSHSSQSDDWRVKLVSRCVFVGVTKKQRNNKKTKAESISNLNYSPESDLGERIKDKHLV